MKIEENKSSKVSNVSAKRRIGSNPDGSLFASMISVADSIENTSPVMTVSNIEGPDTVVATQTIEDATARRARNLKAAKKGESLLDKLEKIRTALLCGTISNSSIIALSQALREKREPDIDPKLSTILDEVELRVEVELAKLEMAKHSN